MAEVVSQTVSSAVCLSERENRRLFRLAFSVLTFVDLFDDASVEGW